MIPKKAKLRAVRLKTAKKENAYHYFIRKDGYGQNGEYIRKKDREIAEVLAQIEYDEKLLVLLQDSLNQYKGVMKVNPFEAALDKMARGKRELVKMPFLSDERYLDEWQRQKYTGMLLRENVPEFYTRKGLRVRSKSELIIADILDEFSVPFLYEKPLQLRGGIVHPDFTLLNIRERRESERILSTYFPNMDI